MNGENLRKPECLRLRSSSELEDLVTGWDSLTEKEREELVRFCAQREILERRDAFHMRFRNGCISSGPATDPKGENRGEIVVKLVRSRITD